MIKDKKRIIAYLLILAPLIDSLLIPTAFGLQWHSAKSMYLFSVYLIPIKLALVVMGGFFLIHHTRRQIYIDAPRSWFLKVVDVGIFILAGIQFILFTVISVLYVVVGTQADDYKQQGNISVYTSDVGAFGKATHYFSYQCTDSTGFYTLQPIVTLDWLGTFTFKEKANTLIITYNGQSDKGEKIKQIDLSGFGCIPKPPQYTSFSWN
ncbi:hypothetical protein [Pseudoalteromonas sp. Ld20]|uniref:hypothetical protein n=1 Tax=Pseudoalteromonas sp. Ld20 TaxID=649165 RepID=UPI0038670CF5